MPVERYGIIAIRKGNGGTYVFTFDQSSLGRIVEAIDDAAYDDELDFDEYDADVAIGKLRKYTYSDFWS